MVLDGGGWRIQVRPIVEDRRNHSVIQSFLSLSLKLHWWKWARERTKDTWRIHLEICIKARIDVLHLISIHSSKMFFVEVNNSIHSFEMFFVEVNDQDWSNVNLDGDFWFQETVYGNAIKQIRSMNSTQRFLFHTVQLLLICIVSAFRWIVKNVKEFYDGGIDIQQIRRTDLFRIDHAILALINLTLHAINAMFLDARFHFPNGWIMTVCGGIMWEIAMLVMAKIVRIFLNRRTMVDMYNGFDPIMYGLIFVFSFCLAMFINVLIWIKQR